MSGKPYLFAAGWPCCGIRFESGFGTGWELPPLQIEVLTGKAVPEDTVIVRHNTSAAMVIDQFTLGIVAFKDSMIDLNRLFHDNKITIAPQQAMSATVAEWQLLAAPMLIVI